MKSEMFRTISLNANYCIFGLGALISDFYAIYKFFNFIKG
jgi:hypothetical protein